MEFTAIGGGHEIGRSCYSLRLSQKNLVVDCGFKFGHNRRQLTPDIGFLDHKRVDAIFVTHGHLDHIGYLPVLARMHPEARIFATSPTVAIMELMLNDTIKIAERNGQTPLFNRGDLAELIRRATVVESSEWFSPWPGWQICFWPAGHMPGAASILIKSPEGNAMFSGDISFDDTQIVNGARLPKDFRPRLLVTEATNGDYELPLRKDEENRLEAKVKEVCARGGHVLIPAFASERGPNAALELAERGFKVYIAGMIRDFLMIYKKSHPNITLINRERTRYDPSGTAHMEEIAKSGATPAVVVATAGMLDFGASNLLAFAWVENPKNAILIPGYQAEEAFGKKLIQVNRGDYLEFPEMILAENRGERTIRPKATKQVLAEVERFHLSGHAGASQMASWISALEPMTVVMVHGNESSFSGLKRKLKECNVKAKILASKNGKTFTNKTL